MAKAGPVETETTYSASDSSGSFDATSMDNYTAVAALLDPYLSGYGGGQIKMVRG
jgi:hypothetical protein